MSQQGSAATGGSNLGLRSAYVLGTDAPVTGDVKAAICAYAKGIRLKINREKRRRRPDQRRLRHFRLQLQMIWTLRAGRVIREVDFASRIADSVRNALRSLFLGATAKGIPVSLRAMVTPSAA